MSIHHYGIVVYGIDMGSEVLSAITGHLTNKDFDSDLGYTDLIRRVLGKDADITVYGNSISDHERYILSMPGTEQEDYGSPTPIKFELELEKLAAFKEVCARFGITTEPQWLLTSDRL